MAEATITATVASLRLDAVAGAAFGTSRTAMAEEVRRGRVRVNGVLRVDPSFALKPADVITLEGRGRATLAAVTGQTRRGRILVSLRREGRTREGHEVP